MILVITSTVIQGNWRINLRRFAPSEPAQDVSTTTTGYDTGYSVGYGVGYKIVYNVGYGVGYKIVYSAGFQQGLQI